MIDRLFVVALFAAGCGGRVQEQTDGGTSATAAPEPTTSVSDAAAETAPSATMLRCTEFRYYECESRCFKVEPMDVGVDCFSSAGCGDMTGYMIFEQTGRVVQDGKTIASFTATPDGTLATVTRGGVTTRCVRLE